jgi:MOSC domain-containing protein YiiM
MLLSLQTGPVRSHTMPDGLRTDFRHPNWTSGIFKSPIPGPVLITPSGIPGDEQSDLKHHGGPDNVVLAYDADHYPVWQQILETPQPFPYGSFGENFTVRGFSDPNVCIGDTWQVGHDPHTSLLLQVTQPRQPCYKLARRLQQPHIVKLIHQNTWGGWYLRVLRPGPAAPGMPIFRLAHPHPDCTISTAVLTMYNRKNSPDLAAHLAALPELSARWKSELLEP